MQAHCLYREIMQKKIMILGASGFIGTFLTKRLSNHSLILVSRKPSQFKSSNHIVISWDQLLANPEQLRECDTIISLCGQSLLGIWTQAYQRQLIESRITPLMQIAKCLQQLNHQPHLIIANGAGYYGYQPPTDHTQLNEKSTIQHAYTLSHIGQTVESCLPPELQEHACYLRLGVVIDPRGGMLQILKLPTQLFGGCIWGNGDQHMSWISLDDALSAMEWIIDKKSTGSYNLCAPKSTTHAEFIKAYAKVLNRPTLLRVPLCVATRLGKMINDTLLRGQSVYPQRLLNEGFVFKHAKHVSALKMS